MRYDTLVDVIDALSIGVPLSYILDRSNISAGDREYATKRWGDYVELTLEETGGYPPQKTMEMFEEELFQL